MKNLVSLLAAVALVSTQWSWVGCAMIRPFKGSKNSFSAKKFLDMWDPLSNLLRIDIAPPETVSVVPGTILELTCSSFAIPPPTIYWLKNGERIPDLTEQSNEIIPPMGPSIAELVSRLRTTAVPGDVFTCVAEAGNKRGMAHTTVLEDVSEDDVDLQSTTTLSKLRSMKPRIVTFYDQILAENDYAVVLLCRVHSTSPTQVIWYASDGTIIKNDDKMKILDSGDLLIRDVSFPDMGQYRCFAQNAYGRDVISTFLLPVFPKK